MPKVCALVITHNRLDKLKNCLAALAGQEYVPAVVLVVDNASTDGTQSFLAQTADWPFLLVHERLSENLGGAGGFARGLDLFLQQDCEAVWLMDDDSLPAPDALRELLAGMERAAPCKPMLAASQVVWQDGNLHPWNIPQPRLHKHARDFALVREGLLPVRSASFVSILLTRQAVETYGLPVADYFIYNDDIEYTGRILRRETGILCPASVCLHDTARASTTFTLPPERLFFVVRNKLWMIFYSPAWTARERVRHGLILCKNILLHLRNVRLLPQTLWAICRGVGSALRRRPERQAC